MAGPHHGGAERFGESGDHDADPTILVDLVTVRADTEMARRYLTRTDSGQWQINHDQDTGDADEVVGRTSRSTPSVPSTSTALLSRCRTHRIMTMHARPAVGNSTDFIADLMDATAFMCLEHRGAADAVVAERLEYGRASQSTDLAQQDRQRKVRGCLPLDPHRRGPDRLVTWVPTCRDFGPWLRR